MGISDFNKGGTCLDRTGKLTCRQLSAQMDLSGKEETYKMFSEWAPRSREATRKGKEL